jgi:iron complex outermembrane receptor protein
MNRTQRPQPYRWSLFPNLSLARGSRAVRPSALCMKIRLLSLAIAIPILAPASPLDAQPPAAAPIANDEAPVAINTLEVSDTAVASPALTISRAHLLTPGSLSDTRTLSDAFAGFHVATSGAHSFNDTIALRGLSNTPIFGSPAVAVYLDEIPLLSAATLPAELNGLVSASLHRGAAASSHFGYAGPAGVLELHSTPLSRRPTSASGNNLHNNAATPVAFARGALSATVGDCSLRAGSASFAVTAPRDTSASVAISAQSRDGYIVNRQRGHDIDHRDNRSGLLRVETHPFAPLTLALTVHGTRSRDGEQPLVPLDSPLYEIERASAGFTEHEAFNTGLTAAVDTTHGQLTATASLNRWDLGPYRSVLAFGPMELVNDVELSRRTQSIELRFVSPDNAPIGWQATAFASRTETDGHFARAFSGFTFEESSYAITDSPLALSANAWSRFATRWKLSAGLRVEHNDQTFLRREKVPADQTYALASNDSAFLPRVELSHDFDAHTAWSLSAAVGRKPGGYSAFTGNRALAAFGPERTRGFETGISRIFPRRRLRSTVRAYAYSISGYQIERSFATGAFTDDYLVVNAPQARSHGVEWETSWRMTDALSLSADLGLGRVTLREFTDPYSKTRYNGRRAPYAPAHDANLTAAYRLPAGFEATLAINSTGRIDYTEAEDLRYAQRSFTLINATLGYRARHWRAHIGIRNLTGREYYSSITPGTGHGTPGAPQTIAFTIEFFTQPTE